LLRARLILELHGPTDAVKELEELIKERDEIACQAHLLLARIYLESDPGDRKTTKQYQQKAKGHQQKGEKLFSETADAYFNQAMIVGTVNKTLECLNKALELEPGHYDSREARALAYHALRDYRNMERDAVVMNTLRDRDSLGYSLMAIALRETEYFADAIEYHNKAIRLSPDEAELYDQRHRTHMRMGNYEQALSDAQECVRLRPNERMYRFHLFCALAASGYYDEAKVKYEAIIKSGLMSKRNLDLSAAKYVSDTLDAGLSWHPPQRRPEGPAFLEMHESAEIYEQLAKKARRVVAEGFHANWSPDGSQLVYSCGIHGFSGIEIINLESGKTRLLTVPGFDPAWSPDGQHIAYVRVRQPLLLADVTTEYGAEIAPQTQREVWIIRADGAKESRFLTKGSFPCWSRDSKRVFYHSQEDMKLYSISLGDGAKPTPLISCPSTFPVVSPDEKYVAYAGGGELRIVELATKSVVASWTPPPLTLGVILNWSPNGRELGIAGRGLWIYNLDTKTASKVLSGRIGWSSWSRPDISRFAFQRTYGLLHREIWVANLDPNVSTIEALGPGRTIEEHYQEMVDYYRRRIDTEPENAGNYLLRAEYYIYLDDQEKAFADFEKYTGIVKDPEIAERMYANMLWKLVLNTTRREEPAIAVRLAKRAIEKTPENWAYHSILGAAQYYAGEYEDAESTLENSQKMHAGKWNRLHPHTVAFLAMSLYQLGQRQKAEATLAKLRHLFENGRNAGLRQYLIEAEQLFAGKDSNIWKAWNNIEAECLDQAMELLSDLSSLPVKDDPNFSARVQSVRRHLSWLYFQRSRVQECTKVYDEAISNYESAVKANPDYVLAYNNLAWLLATCPEGELRDGVKAVENATKACELTNWKNTNYLDTLAASYAEAGDFDEAIKWQQKAIELLGEEEHSRNQPAFKAKMGLYQAGQSYHRQPLFAKQMIAWWKFDETDGETVIDSSGNGCNGWLNNMDASGWVDGVTGGALEFDGIDDYLSIPALCLYTDTLTITAWIKRDGVQAEPATGIVFSRDGSTIAGLRFGGTGPDGEPPWAIDNELAYNWNDDKAAWDFDSGLIIPDNLWVFVSLVVAPSQATLYMGYNGTLSSATNIIDHDVEEFDGVTLIGRDTHHENRHFKGCIDDVRIYSYALSEAEVKELYAGRGPGPNERPE
jgi:tetratricopeptide (TPR) repeat protein